MKIITAIVLALLTSIASAQTITITPGTRTYGYQSYQFRSSDGTVGTIESAGSNGFVGRVQSSAPSVIYGGEPPAPMAVRAPSISPITLSAAPSLDFSGINLFTTREPSAPPSTRICAPIVMEPGYAYTTEFKSCRVTRTKGLQ